MRSYCESTKISDININEPHAGGGNPVLAIGESSEDVMFNDILGTSLGVVKDGGYSAIDKTSFGADSTDKSSFFTGKPYIEDLATHSSSATTAQILANGKCEI